MSIGKELPLAIILESAAVKIRLGKRGRGEARDG
jgi:hypothetical protein